MKRINVIVVGLLVAWASTGKAAVEGHVTAIETLLVETERYGACMIYTSSSPTINCPANWISLDCTASFHSKEESRRFWDTAQLAFAMERRIYVVINDLKKHNGYCVLERLDILR